jgi:hypothetical protein
MLTRCADPKTCRIHGPQEDEEDVSTKTQAELDTDTKLRKMAAAVFKDIRWMQTALVRTRGEEPERDCIRKALEKAYRMGLEARK